MASDPDWIHHWMPADRVLGNEIGQTQKAVESNGFFESIYITRDLSENEGTSPECIHFHL